MSVLTPADAGADPGPARTGRTVLRPLTLRTAGERIAERIVTGVALGEFVPGQRLPSERELAIMLEVSRAVVREAMRRLQAAGYVTARRGRGGGTFVCADRAADADGMIERTLAAWSAQTELLDFRDLVEQQIARTAAERRTESDIGPIRAAVRAYAATARRDSRVLADAALHDAIARATHNERLVELGAQVRREVLVGLDTEVFSQRTRQLALVQHPALADAVIAGDGDLAARLAGEHFALTEGMIRGLRARTGGIPWRG